MADNEASSAGMDEIRGHIGVLTARLKQLATGGQESKAADVLDDISDYYERAVQLRTYRITSLEEELKEANTKTDTIKKSATRGWWTARICMFIVFLIMLELLNPGMLEESLGNQNALSHLGVAFVSVLIFRFLSR